MADQRGGLKKMVMQILDECCHDENHVCMYFHNVSIRNMIGRGGWVLLQYRRFLQTQILPNLPFLYHSPQLPNHFDILHRARQLYWKISKWLGKWNWCYRWTSFHEIWDEDEFWRAILRCNGLQHSLDPWGNPQEIQWPQNCRGPSYMLFIRPTYHEQLNIVIFTRNIS